MTYAWKTEDEERRRDYIKMVDSLFVQPAVETYPTLAPVQEQVPFSGVPLQIETVWQHS